MGDAARKVQVYMVHQYIRRGILYYKYTIDKTLRHTSTWANWVNTMMFSAHRKLALQVSAGLQVYGGTMWNKATKHSPELGTPQTPHEFLVTRTNSSPL